ncbi:Glycoside hydrolase [Macleaya cordata]|uniref:Glycoside hydrolase n=1 Tax=Macleaya cordata TaxID=56857 RepID=A0A200QVX2_MACCD|nr:Glycoside hydrolase [Macleaya cordata]
MLHFISATENTTEPPFACDELNLITETFTFCNTSLPIAQRVENLISLLTLDEKITQLVNNAPEIPRLGIPSYQWWSESLHGIAGIGSGIRFNGKICSATSFPQVILTASSFDTHLWYRIGQVIGIEARAIYNAGQASGMTFWAPNINIFRDPRWGRGQETPGEDPMVASKYSVSYVRGIQGDSFEGGTLDENHLQASACCKHFTAYDLDNWNGTTRYDFDANITAQDLADTYQPPFRSCVEDGRASGIMCAYNSVNGIPNCADFDLLSITARQQWGFIGYIVSDCNAVPPIHGAHRYAPTPEDAVHDVLTAGMDVECGSYLQHYTKSAIEQKKLKETVINRALFNLFTTRMRLGLFNGNPIKQPYGDIGPNQVCSPEHQYLALEAARDGIVLLKNTDKLLPLSRTETKNISVIGPNANATETLLGNYFGPPCEPVITPVYALALHIENTFYHPGCELVACNSLVEIEEAVDLAKTVDNVILIMGLNQTQEHEGLDRVDLVLPGMQQTLITTVAKAARNPVVLVLLSGGPIDISFAKCDPKIGSIIWAGYPGEAGGTALAEIIFGDHNPGGKLPVTWYPQEFTKVPMTDMRMRADPTSGYPGRTYRFYNGTKVFEFGYGLSYTTYIYEIIDVNDNNKLYLNQSGNIQAVRNKADSVRYISISEMGTGFCEQLKFTVRVAVENIGEMAGKNPVLLFEQQFGMIGNWSTSPIRQLIGFQSVQLNAGERVEIEFVVSPCEHLSRANEDGLMVMEEGFHFLVVGDEKYPISILCSFISHSLFSFFLISFLKRSKKMKLLSFCFLLTTLIYTHLFMSAAATQPPFACDSSNPSTKSYTFCKTSLPISQRVQDLISHLTLDEKISQLVNTAPAIPRLGIPSYQWWSESLHGVSWSGPGIRFDGGTIRSATSFPQVILTASSFDTHLWYRIGQAIGIEARAVYNAGQASGMTFWAPNINIFRDPRWGRGQETPGEDPMVTSKYSVSYVRGIQGDSFEGGKLDENHLQASACCKHFTAYDLENWNGTTRFVFNAHVSLQDLADTYQPPFRSCVEEGRASGIMCAYNRVNGVPSCADFNLLSKTARGQWGFKGYITSDCDAVSIIYDAQGYAKTPEDAVRDVLRAGMDVNCGSYLQKHTKSAIQQKKLSEIDINRALSNLFTTRMRLGLFNGNPIQQSYGIVGPKQVCSQGHQSLALEAARDGIVLLKNTAKLLPLSKTKTKTIGVIGPNANTAKTLLGNYFGPSCKSITLVDALRSYVSHTFYHPGCDSVACNSVSTDKAVELAKSVDYVILIMGLDQTQEKEELDRVDLVLPGKQRSLITSVAKAAKKPVVLVLISGGPIDIAFAKRDPNIGSIIWAGYPGEAGGTALAEIIFGDHNPGGRLPITWYPQEFTKVPMTDMRMRADPVSGYPGRTYRFYKGRKVFKFGHGLSYSKYMYKFVNVNQDKLYLNQSSNIQTILDKDSVRYLSISEVGTEYCDKLKFSATVGVKNFGEMPGKHPVLLFVRRSGIRHGSPMKQLIGFQSVKLNAGERAEIEFVLSPCEHLSRANEDGLMVVEEGSHFLVVGNDKYQISIVL